MVWGPSCTLWRWLVNSKNCLFPRVGALVLDEYSFTEFSILLGWQVGYSVGPMCYFLLRGSGGKRHKDSSFEVPPAPGLSRKWDSERWERRIKNSYQAQPLCELFVGHAWLTLLESNFYLIWNLVYCVVPCGSGSGSGSTNYLFWLCPRFKFLKSWGDNKKPCFPVFFFALPGIGIYGANSNKPITERFSNCPSMASMTNW